ncbi:MAG: hypothetical protein K6G89_03195 [Clostridia bacterium]|nr:hypothetical protein [Clostridia bacterium]
MKKLKYLLITVTVIALAAAAASCAVNTPGKDGTVADATDAPVSKGQMQVFDGSGRRIGGIDSRANCSAVDEGIFYSIFELVNYEATATAEYRLFSKETNTDVLLGKIEGQGYEAAYTRTELDGRIYTLAIKGSAGADSVPLELLAFDPANKTMETFTVSENGFPYCDMAAVNGKLLIMNHEMSDRKKDTVYEFDPTSKTVKEVLSFQSEKDSLRGICAEENGFYLLRLSIGNTANEMFLDLYANDFTKTSSVSVNELMVNSIMNITGISSRQDALNEIGMSVSHFSVADGRYMIYENFGLSRIILDLNTGETLLAKEDLYAVSTGNGSPVVYRMDFDDEVKAPEITGLVEGRTVSCEFSPVDSHKLVRSISKSASGTWAVVASDDYRAFQWTLAVTLWTDNGQQ